MLTNFQTVFKRLQRLKELELIDFTDVPGSGLTKKELLVLEREKDKLTKTLGGISDMTRTPSAVWIVDTEKEHIAVGEARKLGIPVVAILDTNCDPDEVDYKIPGNDDAIRSVNLLTRVVADAVADGLMTRAGASSGDVKPPQLEASSALDGDAALLGADPTGRHGDPALLGADEPLPEWEQTLLQGQAAVGTPAPSEGDTTQGQGVDVSGTTTPPEPADAAQADTEAEVGVSRS